MICVFPVAGGAAQTSNLSTADGAAQTSEPGWEAPGIQLAARCGNFVGNLGALSGYVVRDVGVPDKQAHNNPVPQSARDRQP